MPTIPKIEANQTLNAMPTPRLTARMDNIQLPTMSNEGEQRLGQAVGKVVGDIQARAKANADTTALIDAQRQMDEWETNTLFGEGGAFSQRGKAALDLPERVMPEYDKFVSNLINNAANEEQKLALSRAAQSKRSGLNTALHRQMRQEGDRYAAEVDVAALAQNQQLVGLNPKDPAVFQRSLSYSQQILDAQARRNGIPPDSPILVVQRREVEDRMNAARLNALVVSKDPNDVLLADEMLRDMRRKGSMSKQQIFEFVMDDLENSPEIVRDGKGYAKLGINSVANPDIDLTGLDREGAFKIYDDRYWNLIDADNLPENMRLMAFDAAFNQGVGNAKKWLAAADGDPAKFMALRQAHYDGLGGENLPGWNNRLTKVADYSSMSISAETADRIQAQLDSVLPKAQAEKAFAARFGGEIYNGSTPPQTVDTASLSSSSQNLSPEASEIFMKMVEAKEKNDKRLYDQNVGAFLNDVLPVMQENGGNIAALPNDIIVRGQGLQMMQRIKGYKGEDNPATIEWWYNLSTTQKINADLDNPIVRLGLSTSKYADLKEKQEKLRTDGAAKGLDTDKKGLIDRAFTIYGLDDGAAAKNGSSDRRQYDVRRAGFEEQLDDRIRQFNDSNNGRNPDQQELTKMVQDLAVERSRSGEEKYTNRFWQPRKRERTVDQTYNVRLEDIPPDVQRTIRTQLFKNGTTPTRGAIINAWVAYNSARELVEINKERDAEFESLIDAYATQEYEESEKKRQKDEARRRAPVILPGGMIVERN